VVPVSAALIRGMAVSRPESKPLVTCGIAVGTIARSVVESANADTRFGQYNGGPTMPAQIRIYTINRGEMDAFLKHFESETIPLHERVGWPIVATWVNRSQNEFIWIRTHADAEDLDAKTKALQEQREAMGIQLGGNVAKMEIREVEPAFVVVPSVLVDPED
jgi:hypothetical protein